MPTSDPMDEQPSEPEGRAADKPTGTGAAPNNPGSRGVGDIPSTRPERPSTPMDEQPSER